MVRAPLNLGIQLLFRLTSERESACKHGIEKHSESPHINLPTIVLGLPDQLRSHITRRATEDLLLLTVLAKGGKSEINDLYHMSLFFDKYIVQLDISMRNSSGMKIIKSLGNLLEESPASALLNLSIWAVVFDVLVQTDAANIISHDANLFVSFYQIVHSNYVWVINLLQRQYFSLNSFPLHTIIQLALLINLNGVLLHIQFAIARVDHRIGTLTNRFSNLISIQ